MMTAKDKAQQLVDKFYEYGFPVQLDRLINLEYEIDNAKQCALILVNEILCMCYPVESYTDLNQHIEYWLEVEIEINKL